MAKRWVQRPDGSTWGDWGDDDELGRINLLTPEKVLEGVREVEAGISFCLSLPLDYPGGTALNQRRYPPVLADRGPAGQPEHLLQRAHARDGRGRRQLLRRVGRRPGDPLAAVLDAVGLARARGCRVRRRRRRRRREAVYYNGYRAGVDLVGPKPDRRDGSGHLCFAHHLGLEHMAFHGVQGRGVLVDLAHHLGHDFRGVDRAMLEEIMAADNVVVEPGDMLLLHTGFATKVLEWNKNPDPVEIHRMCTWLDARDESLLEWIADSQISALVRRQLRGREFHSPD